jgi:hypothetical protein
MGAAPPGGEEGNLLALPGLRILLIMLLPLLWAFLWAAPAAVVPVLVGGYSLPAPAPRSASLLYSEIAAILPASMGYFNT